MSAKWLVLCLSALLYCSSFCRSAGICGDAYSKEDEADFTETVNRMMAMRLTNWSWMMLRSIVLLQTTAPSRFIAREKTIEKLKQDWLNNGQNDEQDLRFQALEIVALHSLCVDVRSFMGVNLLQRIDKKLQEEFTENDRYPKSGYDRFSIGIASLCLTNYSIDADLVRKTISGQNSDGSFGMEDPIGDTIKLLPSIQCLRAMRNPSFNLTEVDIIVRRARKYVISLAKTNDMGEVIIGYKYLTSLALAGLWFSRESGDDPSSWRCQKAVETVGSKPTPNDSEFTLGDRLMILSGKGFLDVGREDYKCVQPDPAPTGYRPTCNPSVPTTCQPKKKNLHLKPV